MSKHFKTKRKLRHGIIIKYLLIILVCYIIIRICFVLVLKTPILKFVFKKDKLSSYKEYIINTTINNPKLLLSYYQDNNTEKAETLMANYIINERPLIYIYNSHQQEAYKNGKTVLDASIVLKTELNKYNVDVLVEERDIIEFMRTNNMSYNYSYYASKFYVEDILKENNVDLLIDLHRDAVDKDVATAKIGDKNYAKILFVIGAEHANYKKNYDLANTLNNLIKAKYPDITRGVVLKSGANVNGIYNQDLSERSILLEVGSHNSTFDEVNNTIILIAQIIGEYLNEKR